MQLDGSSISVANSTVNTSGLNDGGAIRVGLRTLPSSVSFSNSSLVADPPGIGGAITVDGGVITIAGTTLNVVGLSGGSITLGSASTSSLSLDAFSSLIGGGGASFGLFANSILNNASIVGGTLFINGVAVGTVQPLLASSSPVPQLDTSGEVPLIVSFQSSINPIQSSLINNTTDYSAPGSLLVAQWEQLGIDPLAISLTESAFLYANSFLTTDSPPLSVWDSARTELFDPALQQQGTLLYATGLTLNLDLNLPGFSLQSDALAYQSLLFGNDPGKASSPLALTGDLAQTDQIAAITAYFLNPALTLSPSPNFAGVWPSGAQVSLSLKGIGEFEQALQQQTTPLYATRLNENLDLAQQGFSLQSDAMVYMALLVGGAPSTAAAPSVPSDQRLSADTAPVSTAYFLNPALQLYSSTTFAGVWPGGAQVSLSLKGMGIFDQAVQQLSTQQVNAQFSASEQKAMEETVAKLGLDPTSGRAVPTPAELQASLRQVIDAVRRRIRGGTP